MAKIIALANQKGGVAKTTSTSNLSYALKEKGKSVLIIDFDPQGTLTKDAGYDPDELEEKEQTIYWALQNEGPSLESLLLENGQSIIPSSIQLAKAEVELTHRWEPVTILRKKIEPLLEKYDYILIDCGPSLSLLTVNALTAANEVLIPVKTDKRSFGGLPLLFNTIEDVRSGPNEKLSLLGVLPTQHRGVEQNRNSLAFLREELGKRGCHVFEPINYSTGFDKSAGTGKPTLQADPSTPGVKNYYQLADYIINHE